MRIVAAAVAASLLAGCAAGAWLVVGRPVAVSANPAPAVPDESAPAAGEAGGLRVEPLPDRLAATIGQPVVLAPRRVERGRPPYVVRAVGGPGVTLGALGTLTVAPSAPGPVGPVVITVTDADGLTGSTRMDVVAAPPLSLGDPGAEPATLGRPYVRRFEPRGGRPPYAWSLSGEPPPGIRFSGGTLSGLPEEPGSADGLVVAVTDLDGRQSYTGLFSVRVAPPLELQSLPPGVDATEGADVVLPAPAVAGGAPPYARSVAGAGATLLPDGGVRVVPGGAGTTVDVRLTVRDAEGRQASTATAVAVAGPLRMGAFAGVTVPRAVHVEIPGPTVTGGRGTVVRDLVDAVGAVVPPPAGFAFSGADGALSGAAEVVGRHGPYRIRASDAAGRRVEGLPFEIRVVEPREARPATRREVTYDAAPSCTAATALDCPRATPRVFEVRYPELVRANELAFGCDYAGRPSGVWETFDGREWRTAESVAGGACSALIAPSTILAARFTLVEGRLDRVWGPRAVWSR